ncbi:LppX_LprAFG lipoprotein [[Mycobacterium] kokjensenii]|uniref:LppX_LprAFG lipoprotein n=1 Tax=[Mycobacterium] kokjensenii TaxID=3064287 RepID=A0ABM9LAN6_9MYCO|nr:LppX_LprAFG lipoprotein [Mycolicibacter sp. MU0083]CAJ1495826.1 LppX_LprAFG lipoprotein [Mycolicibacter sp. MU0083]
MRRLPAVLSVVSAAVLAAGCSSAPSPTPDPGSSAPAVSSSAAPTSPVPSPTETPAPTSSKKHSEPLPDASAILKESSATTAALDSAHLSLSASSGIENMAITSLDGDVTRQPAEAAKGYAKIAYRGARAFVEFVVFDGDLYVSQDTGRWVDYGPAENFYDVASILSPETGLAGMLTDLIDPQVEGRETIALGADTVHAVRIAGQVSAGAAKKIVPQLQATKRVSCTVWVEETGAHHLVALKLASGADQTVVITFSNWNAPVHVGKPRV